MKPDGSADGDLANALIALGNTGAPDEAHLAEPFRAGDDELLREQADWAASRIEERHGG